MSRASRSCCLPFLLNMAWLPIAPLAVQGSCVLVALQHAAGNYQRHKSPGFKVPRVAPQASYAWPNKLLCGVFSHSWLCLLKKEPLVMNHHSCGYQQAHPIKLVLHVSMWHTK